MTITIAKPALLKVRFYDTDDMPAHKAAQRWYWHRLSDVVESLRLTDSQTLFFPETVMKDFAPLCGHRGPSPLISYIQRGSLKSMPGTSPYTRVTTGRPIVDFDYDDEAEYFIPAGWSNRILALVDNVAGIAKVRLVPPDTDREGEVNRLFALNANEERIKELPLSESPFVRGFDQQP